MADEQLKQKGGIHIGTVGGRVEMKPGGDLVGGDKITTTIMVQKGFSGEEQKQQFQTQIDQLSDILRAVQAEMKTISSLNHKEKEEITNAILPHIDALQEVKLKTATVAVGQQAPMEVASMVESALSQADGVMERLQGVVKKTAGVAGMIGEYAAKFGPLIASARHLFGLP